MTSRSTLARTRAAPVAVGLDRDAVITGAIAEIDVHGLAAFSLRGLARRLGVNASVIVWHVSNRDVVLAEVVARVLGKVVLTHDPDAGWDARLRTLFGRFRDAVRRHPNVAPLIGADIVSNIRPDFALVESILSSLVEAGVPDERLAATYNAVQASLVGFVTQEFARMPSEDVAAWQAEIRRGLATLDPARHPELARRLPALTNRSFVLRWQNGADMPMDDAFAAHVELVIQGVGSLQRGT